MLCEDNMVGTHENKILKALKNDMGKEKHE